MIASLAGLTGSWTVGDVASSSGQIGFLTLLSFFNGLILTLLFASSPRIRQDTGARLAAVLSMAIGILLFIVGVPAHSFEEPGFLLVAIAALSGYAIVTGYLVASTAARLWTRQFGKGRRRFAGLNVTRKIKLLEAEALRAPTDPGTRRDLVDAYTEVGELERATYHGYVWAELLPRGKAQMLALYRVCQILAERRNRLGEAQPYLRKLIRIYPKSYFASYARRLVNQYEAYADHEM